MQPVLGIAFVFGLGIYLGWAMSDDLDNWLDGHLSKLGAL